MSHSSATWSVAPLGELAESIEYGLTASADQAAVGPRFLRITDIQDGAVDWNTVPYCRSDSRQTKRFGLKQGDIVFARTGATTGKSFLVNQCPTDAVFASYLIRVRPSKKVHPSFLARFFETKAYWDQITQSSTGTAQPGVNASRLKSLRVPLPPIEEQRRIAAVLDQADALRRKRREAIAKLDTLPQSFFVEMFGNPSANQKAWDVVTLGDICTKITDGVHLKPDYTESGVPFISVKDVSSGRLLFENCKFISEPAHQVLVKRCRPEYSDVLYTKVGTYGRAVLVDQEREFSLYVSVCLIKPRHDLVDSGYLTILMNMPLVRAQADRAIKGIGVPDLHLEEIRKFRVPLPPIAQQKAFVRQIARLREFRARMELSERKQNHLLSALQQMAFGD